MSHHACYALPVEFLDVALIEDSKPMQMILRSMLSMLHVRRIRIFDQAEDALQVSLQDPPNLIMTDLTLPGMSGLELTRAIRSPKMAPLCFVPVIGVASQITQTMAEEAMRVGTHLLLLKPVSQTTLAQRISWIINDSRHFVIGARGTYMIEGASEKLMQQQRQARALREARAYHERSKQGLDDKEREPSQNNFPLKIDQPLSTLKQALRSF